jgi:hypothetical protein
LVKSFREAEHDGWLAPNHRRRRDQTRSGEIVIKRPAILASGRKR